ncbi:MAG: CocE/NonD family hydrolase [Chloroflexi bacterium]|nr:CocE/NonD family hydrolase [Chloroflexota bacterium]
MHRNERGCSWCGQACRAPRHHLIARRYGLPSGPNQRACGAQFACPLRDGLTLAADHYFPTQPGHYPTILMRTPYARGRTAHFFGLRSERVGWLLAGQGYHVVIQDVRGRFGSQGHFLPLIHEREDGQDTLVWLRTQPWFNGQLGMWGQSYVGYVQWAIAVENPPELKAIVPGVTSSNLTLLDDERVLRLDAALRWLIIMDAMHSHHPIWQQFLRLLPPTQTRLISQSAHQLPLQSLHPQWEQGMLNDYLAQVTAPAHLVGGWYDVFLREQLADYATLVPLGKHPYLTIGPWAYADDAGQTVTMQAGLIWLDAHLKGKRGRPQPVRLFLHGANRWLDLADWPPPHQATPFYLHPGERWRIAAAAQPFLPPTPTTPPSPPLLWVAPCSPAHPAWSISGRWNNAPMYSPSPPLRSGTRLTLIGPVHLSLYARSDRPFTDFVGRLCVVKPDGRSLNLCDGLLPASSGAGRGDEEGVCAWKSA